MLGCALPRLQYHLSMAEHRKLNELKAQVAQLQQENQRLTLMQNLSHALNKADGYEELASAVLNLA